ncbi:MAG: glycosyltransferase family 4 protein [Thermoplasmatota archaeon]
MRVALVRGYQASPYELQSYAPLAAMGYEPVVFTNRRRMFPADLGLPTVALPSPMDHRSGVVGRARSYARWRLGRSGNVLAGLEKRLEGFGIVHAMETFNGFTHQALRFTRSARVPLVVTVWENIPFRSGPGGAVHREAEAFVAVTERARAALVLEGAPDERIHTIPVGVDLERFRPGRDSAWRSRNGISADATVFLFAARLVWEKGLMDLLHAVALLEPGKPWHVVVAGAGEDAAYRRRSQELHIQDRVSFLGSVPYEGMHELYRSADVLVLPSLPTPLWQEQYGMVLVEAMACGLAVVTTQSGSIPEVVGEAGLLVGPGDPLGLSEALATMLDDATRKRLSGAGLKRARKRFDARLCAAQMARLYASLAVTSGAP